MLHIFLKYCIFNLLLRILKIKVNSSFVGSQLFAYCYGAAERDDIQRVWYLRKIAAFTYVNKGHFLLIMLFVMESET